MELGKRYDPQRAEPYWQERWEEWGTYRFDSPDHRPEDRPIAAIDTPPPTVSGELHLGHCYSYTQTDFLARYWRMRGCNVYYPMGWDDNGLPTERLVEQRLGIVPQDVGRDQFGRAIRELSDEVEARYERLWRRVGLSVDWRYTYRTVSAQAQRAAQYSFIDLVRRGLAYRASAPTIWCPLCRTAIAQAEVDVLEREAEFVTLAFRLDDGGTLPIATTRPELLPACVAIFVNPEDRRYRAIIGRSAQVPLLGKDVPILADRQVDAAKGTGVVMCCTFGDATDVTWWRSYNLPLVRLIQRDGTLGDVGGPYAGLSAREARRRLVADLSERGLVLDSKTIAQEVRVHERCDTPIEYLDAPQWFIALLQHKEELLNAGRAIRWRPPSMLARYEHWVENLSWDWCISRQRYYGVPFPLWYCQDCGEVLLADADELPVAPWEREPAHPCSCGSRAYRPEMDVMDTWATSSLSPQIVGRWLEDETFFGRVFPMTLRPHAHEIIRTWTFYTIAKSWYHLRRVPWKNVDISGYGLLPQGAKISKSRGGGPLDPWQMMERYSADAVRYWAASTGLGRDALVSEDKIASGNRLVTKLWNVARFAQPFLEGYDARRGMETAPTEDVAAISKSRSPGSLWPTDRWLLDSLQRTIARATERWDEHDYCGAREETEGLFWNTLADNYLEMAKTRLYERPDGDPGKESARYALYHTLLNVCKLLAPIVPFVTEEIYHALGWGQPDQDPSIHRAAWPQPDRALLWPEAQRVGAALVGIATAVRRAKTAQHLRLGASVGALDIACEDAGLLDILHSCEVDLQSVSRAERIAFDAHPWDGYPGPHAIAIEGLEGLWMTMDVGHDDNSM
jgi:valyl-tRNA synthetase